MSKLFRIFRKLFLIVLITWVVLWIIASLTAPQVVKMMMPKVKSKAQSLGVEVDQVQYKNIRVSPWLNAVTANKVSVDFDLVPNDQHKLSSSFQCEKIQVQLRKPFALRGSVLVQQFNVDVHKADLPMDFPFDSFSDGDVLLADLPLLKPRDAVRELIAGVVTLFQKNVVTGGFIFSGEVQVNVGKKKVPARIYTERRDDEFRLRFRKADVRAVAKELNMQLSDPQVDMVSYFPLRVPLIAAITQRARSISVRYYHGDHWKQDALRHTLWSYMLTDAFGPEFAQFATDAQEAKPGNEHFERLMDFNNNAVGRAFVAEKVKLEEIPRLVLEDPRIVLSPDAAEARPQGQLLK